MCLHAADAVLPALIPVPMVLKPMHRAEAIKAMPKSS